MTYLRHFLPTNLCPLLKIKVGKSGQSGQKIGQNCKFFSKFYENFTFLWPFAHFSKFLAIKVGRKLATIFRHFFLKIRPKIKRRGPEFFTFQSLSWSKSHAFRRLSFPGDVTNEQDDPPNSTSDYAKQEMNEYHINLHFPK